MARLMAVVCAGVFALGAAGGGVALADKVGDTIVLLTDTQQHDADAKVRLKAVLKLAAMKDKRAIAPLTAALGDSEPKVRTMAAIGLRRLVDVAVDDGTRRKVLAALDTTRQAETDKTAKAAEDRAYQTVSALRGNRAQLGARGKSPLIVTPVAAQAAMAMAPAPAKAVVAHEDVAPALERTVITNDQIAAAPDALRALRMALEECDAQTLGWWIRFPLSFKGATYADKGALQQECKRGAAPLLDADALESAMGGMQIELDGGLLVTVDHTAWRFAWRDRQWWLVAIE